MVALSLLRHVAWRYSAINMAIYYIINEIYKNCIKLKPFSAKVGRQKAPLRVRLCLYNQLKCQVPVKTSISSCYGTYRRARTFTHALTECLRKNNAVPPDVALECRTKRVIPGFRPGRSLSDTNLASRYGIEGEICRPLNNVSVFFFLLKKRLKCTKYMFVIFMLTLITGLDIKYC